MSRNSCRFHWPKTPISKVKKNLAAAFPDVVFSYGTAGRGRHCGHSVTWTGGPLGIYVRQAASGDGPEANVKHYIRKMTDTELAVDLAERDRKHAEWVAGEPARAAARKAAGIAKRAASTAMKRDIKAKLAAAFPDLDCSLTTIHGALSVMWTDGPTVEAMAEVTGFGQWRCHRIETPAFKARERRETRTARRLEASKARAAAIVAGIKRRNNVRAEIAARLWRASRQYSLDLAA